MALFRRKKEDTPPEPAEPSGDPTPVTWEPGARPFDVERSEDEDDDYPLIVSLDDDLAHDHEDTVAALVVWLDGRPGIFEALHEDREVIAVRPGRVSRERVEQLVEAFLRNPAHPQVPPAVAPD